MDIEKPKRDFLSDKFKINKWEDVEKYILDLVNRKIESKQDFKKWLKDKSELEAILEENLAWRYIKMTINTKDKELSDDYTFFVRNIQPKLAPFDDQLNKKLVDSPFHKELNDSAYQIYFRSVKTALSLFSEKNILLESEIAEKSQEFSVISGAQSIQHEGEDLTMQKAALLLKENDEALRKLIFEKISERRSQDINSLNALFSELIKIRDQIAKNANFSDYRDYMFKALGRFDYTKEDCFDFHQSIKSEIVPLVEQIHKQKAKLMGKQKLKPWDSEVDPLGRKPLKPFKNADELFEKSKSIFHKIDPYFGECLQTMDEINHLDLASKDGKSPGGYNYPLYEIGVPFIFMNAVGSHRDLVTMVHEGGHAVHSFLSRSLELTAFKNVPSEIAELASMSMELFTMDYWDEFYNNKEDLKRAKIEQLETILKILPWIAIIDEFQHWIYENPNHSLNDRNNKWEEINESYGTGIIDWSDFEEVKQTSWQRQLHLFEVPFYYIEYGMAQLGALALWKNFKSNPTETISKYKEALSIGYTKSIPEVYKTAGITFDFSKENISQLANFVKEELANLN